jgi:hypothetical protein
MYRICSPAYWQENRRQLSVFNLVTPEELDNLPEDSQAAFVEFVRIAQSKLTAFEADYDFEARGSDPLEDFRYSLMSAAIGAARTFEIPEIAKLEIPLRKNFIWESYRQFRADLDHYVTQILLQASIQRRRDSVPMSTEAKDRIRSHLQGIRSLLDQAQGLTEAKRLALYAKLTAFETALEKSRVNLFAISRVVFEVLSVSANLVALNDSPALNKLLMNIMTVAGEAKAADDENRKLPSHEAPKALLPPRQEQPKPKKDKSDWSRGPEFDDEIPF